MHARDYPTVSGGLVWLCLVGTDEQAFVAKTCQLLDNEPAYQAISLAMNPHGDGKTSERIVAAVLGCA